jgi:Flp pilus assembly protein TadD
LTSPGDGNASHWERTDDRVHPAKENNVLRTGYSALALLLITTVVQASELGDCVEHVAPHTAVEACSKAIDDFTAAIALDPASAPAYNNRGVAMKRKGVLESALTDFGTAIQLDPTYGTALNNRGELLRSLGRLEEGNADFRTASTLDPVFESVRRNLLLTPDTK